MSRQKDYAKKFNRIARADSVIAIILSVFSSLVCELVFCLALNKEYIPGRSSKEKTVAGIHMIEQNSQCDDCSKEEAKINHEMNVSNPVSIVFAKPNNRVLFILTLGVLSIQTNILIF